MKPLSYDPNALSNYGVSDMANQVWFILSPVSRKINLF